MIEGIKKTKNEQEYRAVNLDSSSSLKIFSLDRRKYFKQFVECSKEESEEETKASVTGKIVECLLLEPELFDSKFHLSAIAKAPTGKMLEFVNALCDVTFNSSDEEGNVSKNFEEMATEARIIAGFDWSLKVILDKFTGKDPEIYYNELRTVKAKGLTVVTTDDVANGERIVEALKTNFVTKDIVNLVDSKKYTIKKQLQVEGYKVDGHLFKSMMDFCVYNHFDQTIQVYDLKVTYNPEEFYENYYLYRRSYIQAFLYYGAAIHLTKIDENLKDYRVEIPKFIVCDSINYYNPLIYELTGEDLKDAYEGFEYKGRKYPGVKSLITELKFCLEMNLWNISRDNYLSNGIVKLKKE